MSWWVIGRGSETCCFSAVIALASAVPIHTGSSRWSPLASCSTSTGRNASDSRPTAITRISRTGLHPSAPRLTARGPAPTTRRLGGLLPVILRRQGRLRRRGRADLSTAGGAADAVSSVYRCLGVYLDRMPDAGTAVLPGDHVGSPRGTDVPSGTVTRLVVHGCHYDKRARAGADAVLDAELVEFEGKWVFVVQRARTWSACGPFWPWASSNDTCCPSSRDLYPPPSMAE